MVIRFNRNLLLCAFQKEDEKGRKKERKQLCPYIHRTCAHHAVTFTSAGLTVG
jgi:hypothetical protein